MVKRQRKTELHWHDDAKGHLRRIVREEMVGD